jgi:hypothetical protein
MVNRTGFFPIVLLVSLLLASAMARAREEPVATAPIPPPVPTAPLATAPPAAKATGTVLSPAKRPAQVSPKKTASSATRKPIERKTAAHRPHRKIERHQLVARASPPPRPPLPPRYYPGVLMTGPDGDGPPFPPPWYDRGRPLAAYPGPRGPMPPW